MCKKYIWLKYCQVKVDIGQDLTKYVLTNEKCLIWQMHQSKNFAVLCVYGVTPDISIHMMYTFYQSVYYASHNQSFPSTSEEKHAFWVGFGEHVGDAITHKLLELFIQQGHI